MNRSQTRKNRAWYSGGIQSTTDKLFQSNSSNKFSTFVEIEISDFNIGDHYTIELWNLIERDFCDNRLPNCYDLPDILVVSAL